jgi:uncharacterized protein (DUF1330 family)
VTSVDPYVNECLPLVRRAFLDGGGKYLGNNGKVLAFAAEPPKRLAILVFDTFEKAQATLTFAVSKDARAVGDKYARFRTFAIEVNTLP